MGYNSAIFILNNAVGEIERDPAGWAKRVVSEILGHHGTEPKSFGHGSHCNGFSVIYNLHADCRVLVALGGNYATIIHTEYRGCSGQNGHHRPEEQVEMLKAAADKLGYRLVRKSAKEALREW